MVKKRMDDLYAYETCGPREANLREARHTMEGRPLPTEGALPARMSNMSLEADTEIHRLLAAVRAGAYGTSLAPPLASPAAVAVPAASPNPFETATQESKCFKIGHPGGICDPCSRLLTLAQCKLAMEQRWFSSSKQPGCYICNMKALKPESFTEPFCRFLTDNPTIFHAVGYFKDQLNAADFKEVCSYPTPKMSPEPEHKSDARGL